MAVEYSANVRSYVSKHLFHGNGDKACMCVCGRGTAAAGTLAIICPMAHGGGVSQRDGGVGRGVCARQQLL